GPQGFILACMAASGSLFRYSKLWYYTRQKSD
ncbi:MAG TPA: LPS biosynthesis protein, partial [Alcaligenes faecalis]|nr:LPS biosynthesis protein [Alcaligenes faecalis]